MRVGGEKVALLVCSFFRPMWTMPLGMLLGFPVVSEVAAKNTSNRDGIGVSLANTGVPVCLPQ